MTIACVLCGGRRVWAIAERVTVAPLDRVVILEDGETAEGVVLIAPAQIVHGSPRANARVVARIGPMDAREDLQFLPGADLPPLLSEVRTRSLEGRVVLLEPVDRRIHVSVDEAEPIVLAAEEVTRLDE